MGLVQQVFDTPKEMMDAVQLLTKDMAVYCPVSSLSIIKAQVSPEVGIDVLSESPKFSRGPPGCPGLQTCERQTCSGPQGLHGPPGSFSADRLILRGCFCVSGEETSAIHETATQRPTRHVRVEAIQQVIAVRARVEILSDFYEVTFAARREISEQAEPNRTWGCS